LITRKKETVYGLREKRGEIWLMRPGSMWGSEKGTLNNKRGGRQGRRGFQFALRTDRIARRDAFRRVWMEEGRT